MKEWNEIITRLILLCILVETKPTSQFNAIVQFVAYIGIIWTGLDDLIQVTKDLFK